ncbi:hypothetical protein N7474_005734 [Penicillium riverlandense]|uniref:uncharacterized protein n=1 Tax=Penicillium riverlandense TaxID=1903569 RepID=UPI0025495B1E|nr:uncharacterized protein N7474_005734 [Penicillium riverlandense]KAJ5820143.1 hypothetical protein N7474_005734 [Penicillium riverlandense]
MTSAHTLPATTTFTCLAAFVVAFRLWTRFRLVKSPGWDDMLILVAMVGRHTHILKTGTDIGISFQIFSLVFYAFIMIERHFGMGRPMDDLSDGQKVDMMHFLWLSIPFYNAALIFCKLSALVFFTRIFRNRTFLLLVKIFAGCLIAAGLWMVTSAFVFCIPVHDFWSLSRKVRREHCLSEDIVWFTNAGIQILTDLVILVLPMPLISKLQLPTRQKAGIMLVFGLGVFVVATSSVRLYELEQMTHHNDYTKKNAYAAIWSSLEANISIICACLPPLYPLLSRSFSFCFRPQPLHSSPGSKPTHTSNVKHSMPGSRRSSIYERGFGVGIGLDGGVFFNEHFQPAPGGYSASISKVRTDNEDPTTCDGETGIRVVRELRLESDTAPDPFAATMGAGGSSNSPRPSPFLGANEKQDRDLEMGVSTEGEPKSWNSTIEWDLGDFEFPDYKERMNAPI